MKVKYDLHIHSKLSACANELMTPNNILNMCLLKDLNLIAVTDHNSLQQQRVLAEIAKSYDFLLIFGVELTINEGYHILVYFESLEKANYFNDFINSLLNKTILLPNPFSQVVFNEFDEEVFLIYYNINQNININLNDLIAHIRILGGIIILAHIDRESSGILKFNIDLSKLDFDGFEVDDSNNLANIYLKYPKLLNYKILHNSDSHDLRTINEDIYLELSELSFNCLRKWLKNE